MLMSCVPHVPELHTCTTHSGPNALIGTWTGRYRDASVKKGSSAHTGFALITHKAYHRINL